MREADERLQALAAQLDEQARASLARIVELLTDVSWKRRTDDLAGHTERLGELRVMLTRVAKLVLSRKHRARLVKLVLRAA